MDYKEFWIEAYEEILEETGREPTHEEIQDLYLERVDSLCDAWRDAQGEQE